MKISWQAGSKLLPKAYLNNQWTGFVRTKGRARQERGEEREREALEISQIIPTS